MALKFFSLVAPMLLTVFFGAVFDPETQSSQQHQHFERQLTLLALIVLFLFCSPFFAVASQPHLASWDDLTLVS
jgi:hypothetical protein